MNVRIKAAHIIMFFGVPAFLFAVFTAVRIVFGAAVPGIIMIILSLVPLGFLLWLFAVLVMNAVKSTETRESRNGSFGVSYRSQNSGWKSYVLLGGGIVSVILAGYFIVLLFKDLLRTLPILKEFL